MCRFRLCLHPLLLFVAALLLLAAPSLWAQTSLSQFAILDQERLFVESAAGRKTIAVFQEEQAKISAEAELLQKSLEVEEQALADLRTELEPKEFTKLAQEFNEKTNRLREKQIAQNLEINRNFERARVDFFNAIEPILQKLFTELGVVLVVNPSAVRYASKDIDLTQRAIRRIDEVITTTIEQRIAK